LKFDVLEDSSSNVWELLCSDGEMKIFRRELEENGIVLDPLKAVHTVKVRFFCKFFYNLNIKQKK
jgi:collagen type IV alpha-3-binding protein